MMKTHGSAASEFELQLAGLKRASRKLLSLSSEIKNQVLLATADRLRIHKSDILAANQSDLLLLGPETTNAFRDRLTLNDARIEQMATSIEAVARLPDPVGEDLEHRKLSNGLDIRRVRSPLGTILMIFEARPNVISEVFALSFKSGNAIALRGGSESSNTASCIYRIIRQTLSDELPSGTLDETLSSRPPLPFLGIEDYDRALVGRLLQRNDLFDVCIPRGGDELIKRVTAESRMPVIKNDKGICHLYVHSEADLKMATAIAVNAKTQRPGVCNSIETILVDREVAREFYTLAIPALFAKGVQFFACDNSFELLKSASTSIAKTDGVESPWATAIHLATDAHFDREYLDLKINLKIVENIDLAILHIEHHSSNHSESIVTANESAARRFQNVVDSACVYWNASTRFTDGFELGLGGEIGISTQKLHVRGPVGLKELTSPRWIISGTGQIRN